MNTCGDVKQFMLACGQEVRKKPILNKDDQQTNLYMKLIEEEFKELLEAFSNKDVVEVADACADLKWVIEGLELSIGIPNQDVWDEVYHSNMSKTVDGKVIKREDGKILKPSTYFAPNIEKIIKKELEQ